MLHEQLLVDTRQQLHRILIVNLLEDFVRKTNAIHSPESVVALVIWKVFVFRFQHAEICLIFLGHPTVLPKQYAILVLREKGFCRTRLSAKLGNYRTDQFRDGSHLTGIAVGAAKLGVSGGWMRERGEGGGWYATANLDFSF